MKLRQNAHEHQQLMETVLGRLAPTMLIRGGEILNVYTGRCERKDIAIAGRRIAYVGNLEQSGLQMDETTEVWDVSGHIIVPGYIEPHAHPFQLYNPRTLANKAVSLGTTTLIHDNLFFFTQLELDELVEILDELDKSPVKQFWWARFDAQTSLPEEKKHLFSLERVKKFLSHPLVLQGGELTDWPALLQGDSRMSVWMETVKHLGKRMEGHAPGSSYRTLSQLAAAGVTGDHESISVEEIWNRLELGYMVTLRHSSIRPDLPVLMKDLCKYENVPWHRLMMTTDGSTPLYLKHGFTDYLIRTAIENGCNPIHAYQMVTINPAVYYGLEEHIGGLAPGRLADINILSSLSEPTPVSVLAEGKPVVKQREIIDQIPDLEWERYQGLFRQYKDQLTASDFLLPLHGEEAFPVINLMNPVITKMTMESIPHQDGMVKWDQEDDRLFCFLIDPAGTWITPGIIRGFGRGIDGIASSYSCSNDLIVIGRDSEAMAKAANYVKSRGGGIAWFQEGSLKYFLALPIAGAMSKQSMDSLIAELEPLVDYLQQYGYPFDDPIYTFLFLSSTHLPQVRLTAEGLMRVKDKKIIVPSIKRR